MTILPTLAIHLKFMMVSAFAVLMCFFYQSTNIAQAQTGTTPIGQVEKLRGNATAFRANNAADRLKVGDPIYAGDTVQTGKSSRLSMVFVDRTVFSLSESATLVINNLVYDPNGSSNSMAVDMVEGAFAFLTGRIARTGTMNVETSVAQLGIRGTQPWVTVGGSSTSFTIMSEQDGTTGQYVLLRKGTQNVIATVSRSTVGSRQKFVMADPADTPRLVNKAPGEPRIERTFKRDIADALQSADSRSGRAPARGPNRGRGRGRGRSRGPSEGPGEGPGEGDSDSESESNDSNSSNDGNGGGEGSGAGDR